MNFLLTPKFKNTDHSIASTRRSQRPSDIWRSSTTFQRRSMDTAVYPKFKFDPSIVVGESVYTTVPGKQLGWNAGLTELVAIGTGGK